MWHTHRHTDRHYRAVDIEPNTVTALLRHETNPTWQQLTARAGGHRQLASQLTIRTAAVDGARSHSQHTCHTACPRSILSFPPSLYHPPLSILPLASSSLPLPPANRTSGQLFPAVPDGERSPYFRTSLQPIYLFSLAIRHCWAADVALLRTSTKTLLSNWLIDWRFYVPPDTKLVISETFFPANLLA